MRFVFPAILILAFSGRELPAQTGQLDASPTLFTIMAAINAAGFDAGLESPYAHPLRKEVRAALAAKNIPSLAGIKEFYAKHRQRTDTAELSQYISFALSCAGPPSFGFKQRDIDLPPDVSGMKDLSPLLAAFYQEADIPELWKRAQRDIDHYIERYHDAVADTVLKVNLYLRQQSSGVPGRRFQIFIELLAPPNNVQTRSYGYLDTIVITPSPQPRIMEIRHAYLRYLLDSLATHNQEILERKRPLADHAQRARWLPDWYKDDFLQLTTESLVKAIEARMDHNPAAVQQALKQGFILTPYFAEQLPVYEHQEAAMVLYYADMVKAIDVLKEDARLSGVEFDRQPEAAKVVPAPAAAPAPALTGADKTLDDAERLYLDRDKEKGNLEKAKKLFLAALEETDQRPKHAAAYYGLARIALLEKKPDSAENLFEKILQLDPEPPVRAWTLVYLGKLAMAAGEREQAQKHFQNALQVQGASNKAREEAEKGMQRSSKQ